MSTFVVFLVALSIAIAAAAAVTATTATLKEESPRWLEMCPKRPMSGSSTHIPRSVVADTGIPTNILDAIINGLTTQTLAPCTEAGKTSSPSATAVSVAIVLGGKPFFLNGGCVSRDTPTVKPTETETVYRLASVSKTFAVDLLIYALRNGVIASIDDTVESYFPEFAPTNPFDNAKITWKMLASQLSGLPHDPPCPIIEPTAFNCNLTVRTVLARIRNYTTLLAPPNQVPSYSNMNFGVLGQLVAALIDGKENNLPTPNLDTVTSLFDKVLKEKVTDPLGMTSTGTLSDATPQSIINRIAPEYEAGTGAVAALTPLQFSNPSGGLYSTASDLAKWLDHYLVEYRNNTHLRREMLRPVFVNADGASAFGAPFEMWRTNGDMGGYFVAAKAGDLPGVTAYIATIPELDLGIALLWNGAGMSSALVAEQVLQESGLVAHAMSIYFAADLNYFPAVTPQFEADFVGYYAGPLGMTIAVYPDYQSGVEGKRIPYMLMQGYFGLPFMLRRGSTPELSVASFQMEIDRSVAPCIALELAGQIGQWCHFKKTGADGSGRSIFCPSLRFMEFPRVSNQTYIPPQPTPAPPPPSSSTSTPATPSSSSTSTAAPGVPGTTITTSSPSSGSAAAPPASSSDSGTVIAVAAGVGVGALLIGLVIGFCIGKRSSGGHSRSDYENASANGDLPIIAANEER